MFNRSIEIMKEKLSTLSLIQLKEIAKEEKIKGSSTLKKAELIELLCEHAVRMEAEKEKEEQQSELFLKMSLIRI